MKSTQRSNSQRKSQEARRSQPQETASFGPKTCGNAKQSSSVCVDLSEEPEFLPQKSSEITYKRYQRVDLNDSEAIDELQNFNFKTRHVLSNYKHSSQNDCQNAGSLGTDYKFEIHTLTVTQSTLGTGY